VPTFPARSKARSLVLVALAAGCAGQGAEPRQRISGTSAPSAASISSAGSAKPPLDSEEWGPPSITPTLLLTDPPLMTALEERGLALGVLLGSKQALDNAELSRLPSFAPLVRVLEQELERAAREDKLAGVDVARYSHRLFDHRFLRSAAARFQLVGVVNRLDRVAFDPGTCGETRLIYRLAYSHGADRASRLPMTVGLELEAPRDDTGGCRRAAERWLMPKLRDVAERAAWLRSAAGPLSAELVRVTPETARVVLNLQLVRWPSTIRPDLGGHAEYLLRSFRPDASGVLQQESLENTIDPDAMGQPKRRRELLDWLLAHQTEVDAGTPVLPDALLARRSISVTPRGLSRLANRPYSATLTARDLESWDFSRATLAKSPAGLLRRLDQLSCAGCHQARSVAGFHLLGADAEHEPPENSLALPVSPHVLDDLRRRMRIMIAFLSTEEPDLRTSFAERGTHSPGGYGDHCSLGQDPSFAKWGCDPGLVCSAIEAGKDELIGQCLPAQRQVGDACESGSVAPHRDRRRDRMRGVTLEECPSMICNRSGVGFPGGMCTASCGAEGAVCGPIAVLDSFNACLARGESFLSCIRGNVNPAGLRACDANRSCRDDYVCARSATGGVCLPPYFVFQLRVDGHSSR
jgi:hypothetical protein